MEISYTVKFMYVDCFDVKSDVLDFDTKEKAWEFITKLKKDENIEKIHYIYLTTYEKVV